MNVTNGIEQKNVLLNKRALQLSNRETTRIAVKVLLFAVICLIVGLLLIHFTADSPDGSIAYRLESLYAADGVDYTDSTAPTAFQTGRDSDAYP
ncbi:MAG: hypothetical protein LBR73_02025 [Oscillospiraceae bacterium]|jgi:hypothetical protein|nr:hypothetical protein [Oscillospiraceae bacterium]